MNGLVFELQRDALDSGVPVTDLLRKALVAARKLGAGEFREWIEDELGGYEDAQRIPNYREVRGAVKAWNPYHGWIPVIMQDERIAERLSKRKISQSIGDLVALAENKKGDGTLLIHFPPGIESALMRDEPLQPVLHIGANSIHGIIDCVRDTVLNWALKLEEEGIQGEGMTFTKQEKKKARAASNVHIEHFQGILGNVQAQSVQIGDYAGIHNQLKEAGVSQKERNELENILDELKGAKAENRESVLQRGLDWVKRNGALIGTLSEMVGGWFEN